MNATSRWSRHGTRRSGSSGSCENEVRATRTALERQTLTAPAIDQSIARAEEQLAQLPAAERAAPPPPSAPHTWQLGERARSRSGGWEGRITAIERNGLRATLEVGRHPRHRQHRRPRARPGTRRPARRDRARARGTDGGAGAGGSATASVIRLDRARSVASSLDLRGARVDEAVEALARYLDDAALAGLDKVLIIHGSGTGALRDAVREAAGTNPHVKTLRPGERGEGGDGATIVNL